MLYIYTVYTYIYIYIYIHTHTCIRLASASFARSCDAPPQLPKTAVLDVSPEAHVYSATLDKPPVKYCLYCSRLVRC